MANNGEIKANGIHTISDNGAFDHSTNSLHHEGSKRKQASKESRKGVALVFKDVCVTLNKNDILKRVYGMAKVGQMLAVMGPSGAGKSTLLNTLTGRISPKSGSVTLNDLPVNRHLRRKISYVMQQDIFYPSLTLKETLWFQTMLRLPESMPEELKKARMMEVVDALELQKCFNTKMGGTFVTGLSGGEKKRASIACELLTNPKLLILDEPTSGLDSAIAYHLMSSLDRYAKLSHKTVVTTIHQPSSQIFHMFTNILLLNDGQVAYFGAGSRIVEFFSDLGMHCAPHYNPADFILEQLKTGDENVRTLIDAAYKLRYRDDWPHELKDMNDHHTHNSEYITITVDNSSTQQAISNGTSTVKTPVSSDGVELKIVTRQRNETDGPDAVKEVDVESYIFPDATWQTGFWTQYTTLAKRNFLRQKSRYFSKLNFGQVLFMAVFAGLVWFQTTRTEETAKDRLGILFFVAVQFGFLPAMDAVTALNDDTGVFMRERSAGLYRLSAYYLAVMTTEIPVSFILPTLYVIINYWMVNLMPGAVNFIAHWLIIVLSTFAAQSIGMLISVVITSRAFVMSFTNTFMIGSLLAGGYYNTHVADWFRWIRYLSYLTYSLNALAKMEFKYGDPFECNPSDTRFPDLCTQNSTTIDGELFLDDWDLNFTPLYGDIIALFIVLIVCRVSAYFVLRFLRRPKT